MLPDDAEVGARAAPVSRGQPRRFPRAPARGYNSSGQFSVKGSKFQAQGSKLKPLRQTLPTLNFIHHLDVAHGKQRGSLRVEGFVDHIAVRSEDLRADVREYERLGFSVETMYEDWAMMRDARGFGVALLPPGSKHPQHIGIRVESREALEEAARRENRPVREHRDRSVSFYTKGVGASAVEVIYYPPEYKKP